MMVILSEWERGHDKHKDKAVAIDCQEIENEGGEG